MKTEIIYTLLNDGKYDDKYRIFIVDGTPYCWRNAERAFVKHDHYAQKLVHLSNFNSKGFRKSELTPVVSIEKDISEGLEYTKFYCIPYYYK